MPDAWQVEYLPEAAEDFHSLDHSQQLLVAKAIDKVAQILYLKPRGAMENRCAAH